jgi:hypothetical protein
MVWLLSAAVLLSACRANAPAPTATPPPPTIPPIITRVVTPGPPPTPTPPPTPIYDISPIEGRWYLRVDVTLSGSRLAGELRYAGALDLLVESSGLVSGTGAFSPDIFSPPCDARVIGGQPLAFTIDGTTFFDGTALGVDLQLLPADAQQVERYHLTCPDYGDVRDIEQAVLWPALSAVTRQDAGGAAFAGLHWRIPLRVGWTYAFSADLASLTGGALDGLLAVEVRPARG